MIIVWFEFASGLFAISFIEDAKKHELSDYVPALLWLVPLFCFGINHISAMVMLFSFLIILNSIKPVMGWGDVLILPPYFVLTAGSGNLGYIFIGVGFVAFGVMSRLKGKGEGKGLPLCPFLAMSFWMAHLTRLLV